MRDNPEERLYVCMLAWLVVDKDGDLSRFCSRWSIYTVYYSEGTCTVSRVALGSCFLSGC
jgi:hypothetical protein